MATKALFFLRHYNDIDHITPVISKWVESGHTCDVVLIGPEASRHDFRIEYLSKLDGVRVAHIRELLTPTEYRLWRFHILLLNGNLQKTLISPLVNLLTQIYHKKKRAQLWRLTTDKLLTRSFDGHDGGVVAFDWMKKSKSTSIEWVKTFVAMARASGLGTVSLPHGDSPHFSQLIQRGQWQLKPEKLFSIGRIFDKLVVPNELCAQRYRPFLDSQSIEVLGSPRYCQEWLDKLANLLPPSPKVLSKSQLKIAIFLRKEDFTIFWEEVGEMIHLIAAFPDVEIIIKPHTRGGWKQSLTKQRSMQQLTNVSVADDHLHSAHLMDWADVLIDLATSVAYEAIRIKKPVLAADYLHAGRSTVAEYLPETELRCRDDVYKKINGLLNQGSDAYYIEENRQRFLKEILDVPDDQVLARYVRLLENLCATSNTPRNTPRVTKDRQTE